MRKAFVQALIQLASTDERVLLLTGDLGYLVIEEFIERFPKQFFNMGVAEQNMVGVATGLAEAGFVPFVYSIAPFVALRPFEFIRNGPVYHELPVRIVGVGQGVEYGFNGNSHFGMEDVGVLRTQPGLTIIAPADDLQTIKAVGSTHDVPGPVYFRLSKDSFEIAELAGVFELGKAQRIGSGGDVLLISSGAITRQTIKAAQLLAKAGLAATILVIASIAPAPIADLIETLSRFRRAFTIESHYTTGGIGTLVAEVAAEYGLDVRVSRLGFESILNTVLGDATFLEATHGISAERIASQVKEAFEENG